MGYFNSHVLFFFLLAASFAYAQRQNHFFRKDYDYIKETQSYYKIHTIPKSWEDAKKVCELEGASLFYPEDNNEAEVIIQYWSVKQQCTKNIFVGISSQIVSGFFETIDGKPISDVYDNWAPGQPDNADGEENCVSMDQSGQLEDVNCVYKYSFVCKKTLDSVEWNEQCAMPDKDYHYEGAFKSCYKFHLEPKTWEEAYATCAYEQSYLAVVNSQAEADYLAKLTADAPKDNVSGNYLRGAVHLGFLLRPQGWTTIKGTKLENSGYAKWAPGQPDNAGGNEKCGSMFYSGSLNDLGCYQRCFFICKRDVRKN